MCPYMAGQMFALTAQSVCVCQGCVFVWRFRLTDFRTYKEGQLFSVIPPWIVAVSAHSLRGLLQSDKIVLKSTLS